MYPTVTFALIAPSSWYHAWRPDPPVRAPLFGAWFQHAAQ
jgi:hypothetical protein